MPKKRVKQPTQGPKQETDPKETRAPVQETKTQDPPKPVESNPRNWINVPSLLNHLEKQGYRLTDTDETLFLTEQPARKPRENAVDSKFIRMTDLELQEAYKKVVTKYPRIETRFADSVIPHGQNYCAFSFIPAPGAKPNSKGLYGILKNRGNFSSETDLEAHATEIINKCDSYHHIHMGQVGYPLPLVDDDNDDFVLEVNSVGLKQELQKEMSDDMKKRREHEKKELDDARARADNLKKKEDAAIRGEVDESEQYVTLRVKRANLFFAIYESLKNMKRLKDTLMATIGLIQTMDAKNPALEKEAADRYRHACREAGVPDEKNNILRFLVGKDPFDLAIVPDRLPEIQVSSDLKFFNDDDIDARAVARELVIKAKEGRTDLDDVKPDKVILDQSILKKKDEGELSAPAQ